ncbi:unnamed protein product, partial [marine sediment metagenome]
MDYSLVFKCIDINDHVFLQQDFKIEYPFDFQYPIEQPFIEIDYSLVCFDDGLTYYNTFGRNDKLEIIYGIKADGSWYESVYSTSVSESQTKKFDVAQFLANNRLNHFEDFEVTFIIIGDNTDLTVNYVALKSDLQTKESYRIVDLNSGFVSSWTDFDSSIITQLSDFGTLPIKFALEYKVTDSAGNNAITSTYNGGYDFVLYSTETSLAWSDNNIDLNSASSSERTLLFNANFGGANLLDVYINGFLYGT